MNRLAVIVSLLLSDSILAVAVDKQINNDLSVTNAGAECMGLNPNGAFDTHFLYDEWKLCLNKGYFSENGWSTHAPGIFRRDDVGVNVNLFDSRKVKPLLYFLSGSSANNVNDWATDIKKDVMIKRVSELTADDINDIYTSSAEEFRDMEWKQKDINHNLERVFERIAGQNSTFQLILVKMFGSIDDYIATIQPLYNPPMNTDDIRNLIQPTLAEINILFAGIIAPLDPSPEAIALKIDQISQEIDTKIHSLDAALQDLLIKHESDNSVPEVQHINPLEHTFSEYFFRRSVVAPEYPHYDYQFVIPEDAATSHNYRNFITLELINALINDIVKANVENDRENACLRALERSGIPLDNRIVFVNDRFGPAALITAHVSRAYASQSLSSGDGGLGYYKNYLGKILDNLFFGHFALNLINDARFNHYANSFGGPIRDTFEIYFHGVQSGADACASLSPIMGYLGGNTDKLENVEPECFKHLLKSYSLKSTSTSTEFRVDTIESFSDKVLDRHAKAIAEFMVEVSANANGALKMAFLKSNFLQKFFKDYKCQFISQAVMAHLLKDEQTASVFNNDNCIKSLPSNRYQEDFNGIERLPTTFYNMIGDQEAVHESFISKAIESQISNWRKADDRYTSCENLDLTKLTAKNIKGLDDECFRSAVHVVPARFKLGNKYKEVKAELFDKLGESDFIDAWNNLGTLEFSEMGQALKNKLFTINCQKAKAAAITEKTVINKECFASMEPHVQATVLLKVTQELPDDLLDDVDSTRVSAWNADKNGKSYSGFEVLAEMPQGNRSRLLPKLSTNVSSELQACRLVNISQFAKYKGIIPILPIACVQTIEVSNANFKTLPPQLVVILSLEDKKKYAGGNFAKADPKIIKTLIDSGNFCEEAGADVINILPEASLVHVDGRCIGSIKNKSSLSNKAVQKMPPISMESLQKEDYSQLNSKLTAEQFINAGSKAKKGNSFADEVRAEDMTVERLPKMNEEFLLRIPGKALKGIKKENIKLLPATSLKKLNKTTASNFNIDTLQAMTVDQIKNIGLGIKDPKENPINLFTEDTIKSMPEENKKAVQDRLKSLSQGAINSTIISAFAIIAAIIALFL